MRNLHKIQAGRGVNAPGTPEIPQAVFEELLVNALVHRDYLISAPVRIFIFDNRIEIISPGTLPDNLTVEKIKNGNSNIRNPILVSYVAKGLLPYHGIGSGITRALEEWPDIEFEDMRDGGLFTVKIARKTDSSADVGTTKTTAQIMQVGTKSALSRHQVEILLKCRKNSNLLDLMQIAGRADRTKFRHQVLSPLIQSGLVEMTIPEKPRSSKQQYHLTKKGIELIAVIPKEDE